MKRPTRSSFALAFIVALLGAFLIIPSSATADPDAAAVQRFVILGDSFDENATTPVAANGPIHAHGTDVVTGPRTDRFEFPDGNVNVRHKPFKQSQKDTYDPITCYGTYTERGTWKTTGGTGDYADVKGHGRYKVSVKYVGCDPQKPPKVVNSIVTATGPLSF